MKDIKTPNEIVQDAVNNKETLDYNLLEMQLYLVIKQILIMYFNNQINKEQANNLKQKAIKKYEDDLKLYEFKNNIFQTHIDNIKKTENLRIKLRKQLNENTELAEIVNTCIELIELYSGEEFK